MPQGDLGELRRLLAFEDPDELGHHLPRFASALDLSDVAVARLAGLEGRELSSHLLRLLRERQADHKAQRAALAADRAWAAAQDLSRLARWRGQHCELDAGLLLGPLVRGCPFHFVGFEVPGAEAVFVTVHKLKKAAKTLSCHQDLKAHLGPDALSLRWRWGRGGLDLRTPPPARSELGSVMWVHLPPLEVAGAIPAAASTPLAPLPAPPPPPPPPRPRPRPRPSGAWLGDLLVELGLLP